MVTLKTFVFTTFFCTIANISWGDNFHKSPQNENPSLVISTCVAQCQKSFDSLKNRVEELNKEREKHWSENDESTIKLLKAYSWIIESLTVLFTLILIIGELEKRRERKKAKEVTKRLEEEINNLSLIKNNIKKQDKYATSAVDNFYTNVLMMLECIEATKNKTVASEMVIKLRKYITKDREKLNLLSTDLKQQLAGIQFFHHNGTVADLDLLFEIKSSATENKEIVEAASKAIEAIKSYGK